MPRRIPKIGIPSTLLLLSILVGAQQIETVNRVRVIHNEKGGKWGADLKVRLELVRTIGGLDAEENLSFYNPSDIVRDSLGNIYILDSGNNRIQKLNPEGKYLKTIGRKGQGPGEFQEAYSMDIDEADDLFVLGSGRIEVFSSGGRPLKTIKLSDFFTIRIRLLKAGLIARIRGRSFKMAMKQGKKLPNLLDVIDQKGKIKFAFGDPTDYGDRVTSYYANQFQLDTDSEKNICLSFWQQNRIEKYSPDGKILWRADRPLNFRTDVIEKGSIDRKRGNQEIQPKINTVSKGIAVDGQGRIWVVTLRRQLAKEEESLGSSIVSTDTGVVARTKPVQPKIVKANVYKLEIFDSVGILLGEIPLAHHADGIRIFKDNLFIREDNEAMFYQYQIVEK
ncbi:MAG: 6-bladed beta-propeller [Candidatus Aminicenantes bacterium]|nr:6-bladed beta-propeller [Candidatus Aminicenantes bacterium]